jgi:hypothetical protein
MKDVVSRISTYQPFFERTMTLEQAVTSREMDKLLAVLSRDPAAQGLGTILAAIRSRPLLSRELVCLVSQLFQIALLRAQEVAGTPPPDLLSILLLTLESRSEDQSITVEMEPAVLTAIWPTIEPWGVVRPAPGTLVISYRETSEGDFVQPDGTPLLPDDPRAKERVLSLNELIRKQIDNDPFIIGLLDNSKATSLPGLVPMLARDSRSLRVLEKIIRVRRLHTGTANRDVPRLLLRNPAHIPVSSLRPFVHVRFVSKTDLRHMARRNSDVRPEVAKEIGHYLEKLG